jgi:NitT/TauT family transport system substrate-binding protein
MMKARLFIILLIVLAVIATASCASPAPKPLEKVNIASLRGEYYCLLWVADRMGYFRDNGLQVEIKRYETGPACLDELEAGRADLATAAEYPLVVRSFSNSELRVVAVVDRPTTMEMVARRDAGVSIPADLRGKRIGTARYTSADFALVNFLLYNRLPVEQVDIRYMSPTQLVDNITAGYLDAVLMYEPSLYAIKSKLGTNAISWAANQGRATFTALISTDSIIKARPAMVQSLLNSLLQAELFVKSHPDDAAAILQEEMKVDRSYIDYAWPKHKFELSLDQGMIVAMEEEARWMIKSRQVQAAGVPNYLDFIYLGAMQAVKPAGITVIH